MSELKQAVHVYQGVLPFTPRGEGADATIPAEGARQPQDAEIETGSDFGHQTTKMNFEGCVHDIAISTLDESAQMDNPLFSDRSDESPPSSELDSSQELYSSGEIDPKRHPDQWNPIPPPKGGKRCGIIFVELSNSGRPPDLKSTYFLVVRGRASHIWSFAKGRTDSEMETEEECALREVQQETGIVIDTVKYLPRIVIGRNVYFIYHTTRDAFQKFHINDTYEVDRVEWKAGEELRKLSANKDVRAILRYPFKVFPYHRAVFSPPKLTRTKYSFKDITKFIDSSSNTPLEVAC